MYVLSEESSGKHGKSLQSREKKERTHAEEEKSEHAGREMMDATVGARARVAHDASIS